VFSVGRLRQSDGMRVGKSNIKYSKYIGYINYDLKQNRVHSNLCRRSCLLGSGHNFSPE